MLVSLNAVFQLTQHRYTMESLEHLIARDLFPAAQKTSARLLDSTQDARKNEDGATNIFEFSVTFLELLGKTAYDLLEPGYNPDDETSPRKPVDIHEDKVSSNVTITLSALQLTGLVFRLVLSDRGLSKPTLPALKS